MSQKQKFHHYNNKPTPPKGGWTPVYANLHSSYFKYIVHALQEGRILATDEPAEVYNKNPYLWLINPYKFTLFFNEQSLSCQHYHTTTTLSLCLCLQPHRPIHLHRALYQIPSSATTVNSPPSMSLITSLSSPSPSGHPHTSCPCISCICPCGGRPIAGTPMASISSYLQAHQQRVVKIVSWWPLLETTSWRFMAQTPRVRQPVATT